MSRGGGGPGQAHRRHHQVIVTFRVDYRLTRLFPWCSIALCNCIDHHRVTGLEKEKQKGLQKISPGQAYNPPCPPCFSAATQTWFLPRRTSGRNPPLRLLPAHCPNTYYCIVLCSVVFRGSELLKATVVQQCAFQGTLVDGKIYGRGAQDMKSVGVQVNLAYLL